MIIYTILNAILFVVSLVKFLKFMHDNPQKVMDFMYNEYTKYAFIITLFALGVLYCVYGLLSFTSFLLNNNADIYTILFKIVFLITIWSITAFLLRKLFVNYNNDRNSFLKKKHNLIEV